MSSFSDKWLHDSEISWLIAEFERPVHREVKLHCLLLSSLVAQKD